jgi:uncharacterized protein
MLAERIGSAQLAEMSAQGASLATPLRRADLPRVSEVMARGPGVQDQQPLDATIAFRNGPEGFPIVHIRVQGMLALVCQRCLGPVSWPVEVDAVLSAVPSEPATGELADPFDSIVLEDDGSLALRAAVEDEILAALPLAPVHADRAACGAPAAPEEAPGAQVHRPFAGLDTLLGQDDGK